MDFKEWPYLTSTKELTYAEMLKVARLLHCKVIHVGKVVGQERHDYEVDPAPKNLTDEHKRQLKDIGLVPILDLASAQSQPSCTERPKIILRGEDGFNILADYDA